MSRGIGIVLLGTISLCFWNEVSDKLAKQDRMKKCLKYDTITCYFRLMRLFQYSRRLWIKNLKKVNVRYLLVQGIQQECVLYKFPLNSWNTKYSQNVTCVCKNVLSVILTTYSLDVLLPRSYFRKKSMYVFNTWNNVRDILYNTDVITSIVKLFVHSPVGTLV